MARTPDGRFPIYGKMPRFIREREHQSPVPSQDQPLERPFDPSQHPDIPVPVRTTNKPFMNQSENPGADMGMQDIADVRSVYDARPIMAYDWYWEDQFFDGIRVLPAYRVPDGYVLVLKEVMVEIFPQSGGVAPMTAFGDLDTTGVVGVTVPKLQILVDGVASPRWTPYGSVQNAFLGTSVSGVPIFNALICHVEIPTFIIIEGGSDVTIFIPNFIDNALGGTFHNTYASYYGNLLLAKVWKRCEKLQVRNQCL
jgi:hypothetical protein